jgi:hypothetical protein
MAVINQSPSGQTSIAISGISFTSLVVGSSDPFREPAVRVQDGGQSVAVAFGGGSAITQTLIPASLRGKNTPVSSTSASGIFTLDDQIAAKRADTWPSDPSP